MGMKSGKGFISDTLQIFLLGLTAYKDMMMELYIDDEGSHRQSFIPLTPAKKVERGSQGQLILNLESLQSL